jgi:hypothetical protein
MHSRHSVSKCWLLRALIVSPTHPSFARRALIGKPPAGLFGLSMEASQASHGPERNWRSSARVLAYFGFLANSPKKRGPRAPTTRYAVKKHLFFRCESPARRAKAYRERN